MRIIAPLLLITSFYSLGYCQGTFQNLAFEQAKVPSIPSGQWGTSVLVGEGVPSWSVYLGGLTAPTMFHNSVSLGSAAVSILGPQWFASQILEGSYTVYLQPSTAGPVTSAAIGQTGQIPSTAASVRFYGTGGYTLTFAGQPIPLTVLETTTEYKIFGGDISSFAGQIGDLRFEGGGLLDNIEFSTQQIPEPGTLGLLSLGALLLSLGRRMPAAV